MKMSGLFHRTSGRLLHAVRYLYYTRHGQHFTECRMRALTSENRLSDIATVSL